MKFFKNYINSILTIILILLSIISAQDNAPEYGPGSSWNFTQSTSQSFVGFNQITIFSNAVISGLDDGSPSGACPEGNCDIIALVYNNQVIGWSYCTIVNGTITIAANLNDFTSPGVENYPAPNSTITVSFYHASTGIVYFGVADIGPLIPFNLLEVDSIDIIGDGLESGDPIGCPYVYADNFNPLAGSGDLALCNYPEVLACLQENACNYYIDEHSNCIIGDQSEETCNAIWIEDEFGSGQCLVCDIVDDCVDSNGASVSCCQYPQGISCVCDDDDHDTPIAGFCDCNETPEDQIDCAGVCSGSSLTDNCGVCDDNPDNDCEEDCAGTWGGTSEVETCYINSDGDNFGAGDPVYLCTDNGACPCNEDECYSEYNEDENDNVFCNSNHFDECDVCDGEGIPGGDCDCNGNVEDCAGVCGGLSFTDNCGICNENPLDDCVVDCSESQQVCNGTWIEDEFGSGQCWGGDSVEDECGTCDNNLDNDCIQDCLGVWGGTAEADCFDECNGTAFTDDCGTCLPDTEECQQLDTNEDCLAAQCEWDDEGGCYSEGCSCQSWQVDCNSQCPGSSTYAYNYQNIDNYGDTSTTVFHFNSDLIDITEQLQWIDANIISYDLETESGLEQFELLLADQLQIWGFNSWSWVCSDGTSETEQECCTNNDGFWGGACDDLTSQTEEECCTNNDGFWDGVCDDLTSQTEEECCTNNDGFWDGACDDLTSQTEEECCTNNQGSWDGVCDDLTSQTEEECCTNNQGSWDGVSCVDGTAEWMMSCSVDGTAEWTMSCSVDGTAEWTMSCSVDGTAEWTMACSVDGTEEWTMSCSDGNSKWGLEASELIAGYDCIGECSLNYIPSILDLENACCSQNEIACNGLCGGPLDYYPDPNGVCCDENVDCAGFCIGSEEIVEYDACENCLDPLDPSYSTGMCYTFDGNSTSTSCSQTGPNLDNCPLEEQCFVSGLYADYCGNCDGQGQCINDIMATSISTGPEIEISWSDLTGVGSYTYEIYRYENLIDTPYLIDTTSNNSYLDQMLNYNTEYCYNIAAVTESGYIDMVYKFSNCATTIEAPAEFEFYIPHITSPANLAVNIPIRLTANTLDSIRTINLTIAYNSNVIDTLDFNLLNSFAQACENEICLNHHPPDCDDVLTQQCSILLTFEKLDGGVLPNSIPENIIQISGVAGMGNLESETTISFTSGGIIVNSNENSSNGTDGYFEIANTHYTISGDVIYYNLPLNGTVPTPNTILELDGITNFEVEVLDTMETDVYGVFQFNNVPPGDYYSLTASKGSTNLGGELTANDASLIARYTVGLEDLSYLQIIAADVTLNGNISGLDASRVARYSINAINSLNDDYQDWVFFPNTIDIGGMMAGALENSSIEINTQCIQDGQYWVCEGGARDGQFCNPSDPNDNTEPICPFFHSIRLGDVTGNWWPVVTFAADNINERDPFEITVVSGDEFSIPIHLIETDLLAGINVTIEFDPNKFTFDGVELIGNSLISNSYELLTNIQNNFIYIAIYGPSNLVSSEQLAEIKFSAIESQTGTSEILLSDISVNENISESGFYFESDDGVEILTNEVIVNISELNISELAIPEQYNLYQNTPNPFNPLTEIAFDLPERSKINLEIYDITGARVKILIENKVLNAGKHVVSWDAGLYSAGIYFYRIKAGSFSSIQKMILLK